MFEKQEEFFAWLSEVKGVPQDACGQRELKEHFSSYCEDYNTATFPTEKYYNLRAWMVKEQKRKASKQAAAEAATFERTSFNDEADRHREIAKHREHRANETSRVMAQAMKSGEGLVADMREQEQLKMSRRAAYATGDTNKARELVDKLDPSRLDAEELRKKFGSYAPSLQKG